jgi:hypothetical protein
VRVETILVPRVGLILYDSDVSGGGSWQCLPGYLRQLFELTFFPTPPERATP